MAILLSLILPSLPIEHSKHKQTKKNRAGQGEGEGDAHRLVVDKKEGEQSHGKRGKGEKMR